MVACVNCERWNRIGLLPSFKNDPKYRSWQHATAVCIQEFEIVGGTALEFEDFAWYFLDTCHYSIACSLQTNIGALLPHAPMQCVHSTACKEHCGQRSAAKAVVTVSAVAVFCCDL